MICRSGCTEPAAEVISSGSAVVLRARTRIGRNGRCIAARAGSSTAPLANGGPRQHGASRPRAPVAASRGRVWHTMLALDRRSLAALRVVVSGCVLCDLLERADSLEFYTSGPPGSSVQPPHHTPHQAPPHRLWFFRGPEALQLALFAICAADPRRWRTWRRWRGCIAGWRGWRSARWGEANRSAFLDDGMGPAVSFCSKIGQMRLPHRPSL